MKDISKSIIAGLITWAIIYFLQKGNTVHDLWVNYHREIISFLIAIFVVVIVYIIEKTKEYNVLKKEFETLKEWIAYPGSVDPKTSKYDHNLEGWIENITKRVIKEQTSQGSQK